MNLALAADWLTTYGGAEHVIAEFLEMYPGAPLYTTVVRRETIGPLASADIRTSRLQRLYRLIGKHQVLLTLMPRAVESLDVRGCDVLLSSSHAVGKGIIPESRTLHVCYCHTPMRYAWEMEEVYLDDFGVPRMLRPFVRRQLDKLRRWDLTTAQRVDLFLANSRTTQERIKRIYGRESIVIPPPVEDKFFDVTVRTAAPTSPYFLAVGRMVPYKRFDLLIEVANELKLPLTIVGRGQDEKRLRRLAGPTITFAGFVPAQELPALYANAEALLFPQYEDAGIVQLEAQACGTPVIAFNAGGAQDLTKPGMTSILFDAQTKESLTNAIETFRKLTWNRGTIRAFAENFSQKKFRERIKHEIDAAYEDFTTGNRDRFFA